jgi:hypothetical protein
MSRRSEQFERWFWPLFFLVTMLALLGTAYYGLTLVFPWGK